VRFANESSRFPTLAEKLEHMFKQFMLPNAGKTKAKSPEDEVKHLTTIFRKISNSLKKLMKHMMKNFSKSSSSSPRGLIPRSMESKIIQLKLMTYSD
jgi:hypothetical protein